MYGRCELKGMLRSGMVLVMVGAMLMMAGVAMAQEPGGDAFASPVVPPYPAPDLPEVVFSGGAIAAIVGVIVSLLARFSPVFFPAFAVWWEANEFKREWLQLTGFVVAWVMVGLHYAGAIKVVGIYSFGWPVVWRVMEAWLVYVGGAQVAYTVQKRVV